MIGKKTTLILSQSSETISTEGGITTTYKDIKYISGQLTTASGNEAFENGKIRVKGAYTFYCDYQVDVAINEKYIFRLNTRTFDITDVDNIAQQNRKLKISLLERT